MNRLGMFLEINKKVKNCVTSSTVTIPKDSFNCKAAKCPTGRNGKINWRILWHSSAEVCHRLNLLFCNSQVYSSLNAANFINLHFFFKC